MGNKKHVILSEIATASLSSSSLGKVPIYNIDTNDFDLVAGGEQFTSKYLISGGASWSGMGLTYDITTIQYYFNGNKTTEATNVTLDASDPDNNRFDAIVVDEDGTNSIISGEANATPITPSIPDSHLLIQYILVEASTTEPNIAKEDIYLENTEWTTSTYTTGVSTGSIDFDSALSPKQGVKCISANTDARLGARFVRATSFDPYQYTMLSLWVRFTGSNVATNKSLKIRFENGAGSLVANSINLFSFGLQRNLLDVWQLVVAPITAFGLLPASVKGMKIIMAGGTVGQARQWDIDLISLTDNSVPSINEQAFNILKDGTLVGQSSTINFKGAPVTVTNDPINKKIDVEITGGNLFPNGVEIVSSTRDFRASDVGKFLVLLDGVGLTMPVSAPFIEKNKLIGVFAGTTNYPCDNYFERTVGEKVYMYSPGYSNQSSNESLILISSSDFYNTQQTVAPANDVPVFLNEGDTVGYTSKRYFMDIIGSGGSPGGSDNQIQINQSGAFFADSTFQKSDTGFNLGLDHTAQSPITFTGSGLDDLTLMGKFSGTVPTTYTVTIDGVNVDIISIESSTISGGTFAVGNTITNGLGGIATVNSVVQVEIGDSLEAYTYLGVTVTAGTFGSSETIDNGTGVTGTGSYEARDTFGFTDGTITYSNAPVLGGVLLSNGIKAEFANPTGHTLSDEWTWTYSNVQNNILDFSNGTYKFGTDFGTDYFGYEVGNNFFGGAFKGSLNTWFNGSDYAINGIYDASGSKRITSTLQVGADIIYSELDINTGIQDNVSVSGNFGTRTIKSTEFTYSNTVSGIEHGISHSAGAVTTGNLSGGNNTKITIDDDNKTITLNDNFIVDLSANTTFIANTDGTDYLGGLQNDNGTAGIFSTNTVTNHTMSINVNVVNGLAEIGNVYAGNNTKITIDDIAQTINFNNNYSFPFADGAAGQVLGTDGSGQLGWQSVSGGGGQIAFTKTKAEIDALIAGNDLVAGALYEITGVHPTLYDDGTTSGTTIYLRAISTNQLEVQGIGKFYNPKYNKSIDGFGIYENKMYGTLSNVVGVFKYLNKELVTANNGATGLILADGMIQWVSGDWSAAVSITGSVSGATADVVGFVTPSYSIGDKVIWGGYSWTNVNGNVGTSTDVLNLDSEWAKDVYDTTNYNLAYDVIEYDYANDFIVRRYNEEANIDVKCSKAQYDYFIDDGLSFNTLSVQQWGNNYNVSFWKGQFNIICNNGYNESVNFNGSYQQNLTFGNNSSQSNITFGSGSYQQIITFGNNSGQSQLTFGSGSNQHNLTFGSGSSQSQLTFGISSNQQIITFGSGSSQSNITFGSGSYQQNLTFGSGSALIYNSQVISSNMEYITFTTKTATVPDLSAATLIFDSNIKEVYQRPDGALKIRYYDNSDTLVIADIAD